MTLLDAYLSRATAPPPPGSVQARTMTVRTWDPDPREVWGTDSTDVDPVGATLDKVPALVPGDRVCCLIVKGTYLVIGKIT